MISGRGAVDWMRPALVMVAGAVCLAFSVRVAQGSIPFYVLSLGLGVIWAVGAVWVGGVRLGTSSGRARRVGFVSTVTALGVAASFIVGGYLAARVPFLDDQIDELISRTDHAFVLSLFLVAAVTGVAEEMFFRGALFDVASRSLSGDSIRTVAATTILYTVVTAVTANLGLTLAAAALGAMVGTARAYSGSVIPAIVGHLAWTVATIGILPQLI
ncbi:hypothetical protein MP11Mi_23630 [Gordonia sp. MP11Mi]|uniref:CAAX prenyl protease 2/Lysostaphin resistance protein A-like domain-containing protein n=1 Tax=Gordonia sp. MP11Mi TaxID=3022769 RepID=A0AA97CWM5_9ACTN